MLRWLVPLILCSACIEDVPPTGDPDPCTPEACGEMPPLPRCENEAESVVRCEAQRDGACGWTIEACEPPPPVDPVLCSPVEEACGPTPQVDACPDGTARSLSCEPQADGACEWFARPCDPSPCTLADCVFEDDVGCPPDTRPQESCEARGEMCVANVACVACDCDPNAIPDGAQCEPGFENTLECVDCAWVTGCAPVDMCPDEACGEIPPGEACGENERSVIDCRSTRHGCEWYFACEPIECGPGSCEGGPPMPNCAHYTAECAPRGGVCDWQVECIDLCELPFDEGPCDGIDQVWWYNAAQNRCEERNYGGCEGNANRFPSEEACVQTCAVPGGGPGEPECQPLGETRLVEYRFDACLDGDGNGDAVIPLDLQVLPGMPCPMAQVALGDEPAWAPRRLTPEGIEQTQALVEALRGQPLVSQMPACEWGELVIMLDGQRVEVVIDLRQPNPALAPLLEFSQGLQNALAEQRPHPAVEPVQP